MRFAWPTDSILGPVAASLAAMMLITACTEAPSDSPLQPTQPSAVIGYCPPGAECYPLSATGYENSLLMDIQAINGGASARCLDAKLALMEAHNKGEIGVWDEEDAPNYGWGAYSSNHLRPFRITLSTVNWTDPMAHIERIKTLIHEGHHYASDLYRNEPYDYGDSDGSAEAMEDECRY
jgi:hypothetical protein